MLWPPERGEIGILRWRSNDRVLHMRESGPASDFCAKFVVLTLRDSAESPHNGVEVLQPGIVDHHAPAAVLVLDPHLQSQLAFQL